MEDDGPADTARTEATNGTAREWASPSGRAPLNSAPNQHEHGAPPGDSNAAAASPGAMKKSNHADAYRSGLSKPRRGEAESVKDYFFKASQPVKHRFGKRVDNQPYSNEYEKWDFLKHGNEPMWAPKGSLRETKFHTGFLRRPRKEIDAYYATSARIEREPFKSTTARRDTIAFVSRDCRTYDIISGESRPATSNAPGPRSQFPSLAAAENNCPRGRKRFPAGHGAPRPGVGLAAAPSAAATQAPLRSEFASFRFFNPPPATANARSRAKQLALDGVQPGAKKSSVLGFGRGDLPSAGVADNFGNSYYLERCRSADALSALFGGATSDSSRR